jgi:hypothetical protein
MGIVQASIGCAFTRTRLPALHAPLEQMRDVELSPYYPQIARDATFVLHYRSAADYV